MLCRSTLLTFENMTLHSVLIIRRILPFMVHVEPWNASKMYSDEKNCKFLSVMLSCQHWSIVFFTSLNWEALSDVIHFGLPRHAINLLRHKIGVVLLTCFTTSECITLVTKQVNKHIQTWLSQSALLALIMSMFGIASAHFFNYLLCSLIHLKTVEQLGIIYFLFNNSFRSVNYNSTEILPTRTLQSQRLFSFIQNIRSATNFFVMLNDLCYLFFFKFFIFF